MRRITQAEAVRQGYTVDRHCYPHIGYRGARFDPTEHVEVLTDLEAAAVDLLRRWSTLLGRGDVGPLADETDDFLSGAAAPAGTLRRRGDPPAKP